jgi:recombinase
VLAAVPDHIQQELLAGEGGGERPGPVQAEGGRPPSGFMLGDAGPHPNPAKAADGKRLHVLVPDPAAAPVVARNFDMYVRQGLGIKTIAQRLTDEDIPSPSGRDPPATDTAPVPSAPGPDPPFARS